MAIASVVVVYAIRLVLFTVDLERLEATTQNKASAVAVQSPQVAERFGQWQHVYGFSGMASRSLALNSDMPMSVGQKIQLDVSALSENPTDGLLWLAYARNIAQSGVDFQNATEAVDVSRLVGRREQVIMVDRILFTLSNWTRFPANERTAALREIHDLRWFLRPAERAAILQSVGLNPKNEQQHIYVLLGSALAN